MNIKAKSFALCALGLLTMLSCRRAEGPKPEELAGKAAKLYYENLIAGNYAAYVDGFYRPDSIPGSYREQLITSAKQYVAQMKEDHKGLVAVDIAGAKADTAKHVGHAFLMLCFKDSVREEIVVPMVLHDGNWMLR